MGFFFSKKYIITLDIGSKFIKAARFEMAGKDPVLHAFEMIPTPIGSVSKGEIINDGLLQQALQELIIKRLKYTSRDKVNISIEGKPIITKRIDIPQSEKKLMKDHVQWEANQYLPYDIEEVNYDYTELPFPFEPGMTSILFVSSHKKSIIAYTLCLSNIAIQIDVMDTVFFALQRALTFTHSDLCKQLDKNVLILDIGYRKTGFTVIRAGKHVIFNRELFVGVSAFIEEIQIALGVTKQEAEGLFTSACKGEDVPNDVTLAIQSRLPSVCKEIMMGVEYFNNHFQNEVISEGYFIGGGMHTPYLIAQLSEHLNYPLNPLCLLEKIQTKGFSKERLKIIQPFVGACVGLVLR